VVVWLLCNAALIVTIQNANGLGTTMQDQQKKTNAYFSVILWTTAGLSVIRFTGCVWFL
jgi:chitin synthase